MNDCKQNPRCSYYDKAILWYSFGPLALVSTIGGITAILKPELFGF